jgi:hypothetical protein
MSIQQINAPADPSAEKKVSEGIDRAYQIFGPNLAALFDAVREEIKSGERKPIQLDLPLIKSKSK